MNRSLAFALLFAGASGTLVSGCAPLLIGGAAAGTAMVATDRRLVDVQVADERIELTASSRISDKLKDKANVSVTSFNRTVLLTGQVWDEASKAEAERIAASLADVRGVNNELTIAPASSWSTRSNDSYVTSQVKARLVTANTVNPLHVKVVTESGVVYLMGVVTEKEAAEATQIARTTSGVKRVVRLFEPWPARASAPPAASASPPAAPTAGSQGVTPVPVPAPVEQRPLPPAPQSAPRQ
jgi:osmotically-inducible protein OsmY